MFNFSPYEVRLNMLPISRYDEQEAIEGYLNSATFGIGKLEAVVASGIKQTEIKAKHEVEEYLNLKEILSPLASSCSCFSLDLITSSSSRLIHLSKIPFSCSFPLEKWSNKYNTMLMRRIIGNMTA